MPKGKADTVWDGEMTDCELKTSITTRYCKHHDNIINPTRLSESSLCDVTALLAMSRVPLTKPRLEIDYIINLLREDKCQSTVTQQEEKWLIR